MSRLKPDLPSGLLLLEDGTYFRGYSFGAKSSNLQEGALGEVIFNTAMTGYQEVLTDPSYKGQTVVMTYPHIGNYGVSDEDQESRSLFLSGFIVQEFAELESNWRSKQNLSQYLQDHNIPALCGIDTRKLTRHIRSQGAMNSYIISPAPETESGIKELLDKLKQEPHFGTHDLVNKVSTEESYAWSEKSSKWNARWTSEEDSESAIMKRPKVVVLDLGCKQNILRNLTSRNCDVKVVSADTSSEEILALNPQGLFLSNGPGDPSSVAKAPETVRNLLGKMPIFGICMGHQILAEAIGAKTFKMKFGHHGANHPVLDKKTGRVMITSQNHGYAVDPDSLPDYAEVTQLNLNDNTVAGIVLKKHKAFSVQFHPEACPGPRDAEDYFDDFVRML